MNWGNYIKRTAVRRVVWIVVGLAVYALLGYVNDARAQGVWCGTNGSQVVDPSCTLPVVASQCREALDATLAYWQGQYPDRPYQAARDCAVSGNPTVGTLQCQIFAPGQAEHWCGHPGNPRQGTSGSFPFSGGCPDGEWRDDLKQCAEPCTGLPPLQGNFNTTREPIQGAYCVQSCRYNAADPWCTLVTDGPNPGYWCNVMYNPTGEQCEAGEDTPPFDPDAPEQCGVGEVQLPNGKCGQQGTCPIGQHEVDGVCHTLQTCPVGEIKAPDGSCQAVPCPFGQAKGKDGTCKHDGNQNGIPDEEEHDGEGTNNDGLNFSGGDDCHVPPTCSGDAIMCGQARIQWRIECNTRRASGVAGGDACSDFNMPICVGEQCDPVEQKQLILQWRSMCALENLYNQDGEGEGDGGPVVWDVATFGEDVVDSSAGTAGDGGDPGQAFTDGSENAGEVGDGDLDTEGLGFGTSCPALPSINVLGTTLDFNTIGPRMCDWMTLAGYIVLVISSLVSLRILAGGMNV